MSGDDGYDVDVVRIVVDVVTKLVVLLVVLITSLYTGSTLQLWDTVR